jgi:chromosome segregation protein
LDEIDAALDDRNIGFFLSVLEEFSRDSQFIIITHNKHTVTGSRTLLGVTQIEPGVSATVSYKNDWRGKGSCDQCGNRENKNVQREVVRKNGSI